MSEIETSLLTTQVYNVIRRKILGGKYSAGEKLDIHKLAEEFGVSRSPVKDAINQLVHEGLVEIIPRKGTYVTQMDLTDYIELHDARLMIEMWAAQRVVKTVQDEEIAQWEQIIREMNSLLDVHPFPFELYNQLDLKFHRKLVQWTGNKKVHDMYFALNSHVTLSRIVYSTSFESTLSRHKDHEKLLEALKERNIPSFLGILQLHIESVKKETERRWNELMKKE
ncbi:GntR family transcriptional regulator [Cohnella pontilimi]|uniref:GntR family transcriptional regulator n=1 Tax=Cohnella pontilimi TaxID=2564100 RepID=A0A4U0F6C6_9BACL|nr:GntR family transcriptional regulator [Cohnella pontilimi]TJY39848.1 GntR family transcriptional regulator [Cohnella pontilimi]